MVLLDDKLLSVPVNPWDYFTLRLGMMGLEHIPFRSDLDTGCSTPLRVVFERMLERNGLACGESVSFWILSQGRFMAHTNQTTSST